MAAKSFLTDNDISAAREIILAPDTVPSGDESRIQDFKPYEFSKWLETSLLQKLAAHPEWESAGPIALGSWSRGELTPKSDIDLLFVGSESSVRKLTDDLAKSGIKLRYRMPADLSDWTVGVEPFDVLALISAIPLTPEVEPLLKAQKHKIELRWRDVRKQIAKAMKAERKSRAERFDSIGNYLEPNLKYGPGGLRDLEQALSIRLLFPERFENQDQHPFNVLNYYKRFFLLVRQRLHLSSGASDLLAAPEQHAIANWLGFASAKDFMKEIQKGISRVSFYADWIFEQATASKAKLESVHAVKLSKPEKFFDALLEDSSVLMQQRVRLHADEVFHKVKSKAKEYRQKTRRMIGRKLTELLDPLSKEASLIALFRSRLIDHCVPEFRRIVGHVQHDQYHRFSVDAHILQALRELSRVKRSPGLAGKLSRQVKTLTKQEWEILSFACLYHDIAKGREGDHSIEGIGIAKQDLEAFGKSDSFINEVTWIVEQHLALSAAAFRENPSSPKTWRALSDRGVEGRRIPLLAVFTFVDIRATNPDAWTSWKERLLDEIVTHLEKPEAESAIAFGRELRRRKLSEDWVEKIDSFLVSMVPPSKLVEDLSKFLQSEEDLSPLVQKTRDGQTWIRFHAKEDQPGIFANYVAALSSAGLGIRHASIHTFKESGRETGVYDWFEVKTEKTAKQVEKSLSLVLGTKSLAERVFPVAKKSSKVVFDRVSLVSFDKEEWVISFRGKDQPGALLQAARALLDEQSEIRWARVHTWGRQIDDVFGIKTLDESRREEFIERLNRRFQAGKSDS